MSTKAKGLLLADYRRVIKAAKKENWKEVTVKFPDGCEIVIKEGEDALAAITEQKRPKLVW